ncbi:MAG: alanine racemase [Actinomycetota bacterium]
MSGTEELAVWVEVDLGCIRRNVSRLRGLLAAGTKLLAVVKANAYGHGDVPVARAALEGGADWLGVARVGEGAALRAADIRAPILLLAEPPLPAVRRAVELDLVPTLYTLPFARVLGAEARRAGRRIPVHVKVDTGMHRYGVAPEEVGAFWKELEALESLRVEGIWSHFAVAEEVLNPFTERQHRRFLEVLGTLGALGSPGAPGERADGFLRHLSNSAGLLTFPEAHLDMVRAGIAIYGIHPSPALEDRVRLEPALSLKARVGLARPLRMGEAISYGQRYVLARDGSVATVPCGYADGLSRSLTNRGEVLIRGRRYRISGTVTMDHFMVDLGGDEVSAGDEVVLLGRQETEAITAREIADTLGTIPYEVVAGLSARVPRVYLEA